MTIIKEFENTIGKIILEETGFKCKEEAYQVHSDTDHMFTWKYFADISDAVRFYEKTIMQANIVEVINKHTREMEGYSYYGSNPGIPTDSYEGVANDIMAMMEINNVCNTNS